MKELFTKLREAMAPSGVKLKEERKFPISEIKAAYLEIDSVVLLIMAVVFSVPFLIAMIFQYGFLHLKYFAKLIWTVLIIAMTPPPLPNLDDDDVCQEVCNTVFDTVINASDILDENIYPPNTVNDMYDSLNYRGMYNDAHILKVRFYAKLNSSAYYNQRIRDVLQGKLNARVNEGHMSFKWAKQADTNIPLIKIATVEHSANFFHVGILLTNIKVSVEAARISDSSTPQPVITLGGGSSSED